MSAAVRFAVDLAVDNVIHSVIGYHLVNSVHIVRLYKAYFMPATCMYMDIIIQSSPKCRHTLIIRNKQLKFLRSVSR